MLFCIRGVALLAVSTIIVGQNPAEGATNKFSIMYSFFDKNELFHASTVCRGHHKYTRELAYTISWQRSNFPAVTLLLYWIKPKSKTKSKT